MKPYSKKDSHKHCDDACCDRARGGRSDRKLTVANKAAKRAGKRANRNEQKLEIERDGNE